MDHSVLVVTLPENMSLLRLDFDKLEKTVKKLPCNIHVNFLEKFVLQAKNTPTTYYGKQMEKGLPPMIEFPVDYFSKNQELRVLIFLHELIHACQHVIVFQRFHRHTMAKRREYKALAEFQVTMEITQKKDIAIQYFEYTLYLIDLYYKIIFEAWNHLYMKENYPELFEKELTNVHEILSNGTKNGLFDNWDAQYMLEIHSKLLESTFFAKICNGYSIQSSFEELAKFWDNKLNSICKSNEFEKLTSVKDKMTTIDSYPNSETLELQYLMFCQLIWDRTLFD